MANHFAVERAIADIPKGRFAGAVLLTDGQVHDVPKTGQKTIEENANKPGIYGAPLHVLLTDDKGERGRGLVVVHETAFGIVGKSVTLRLRIEDNPKKGAASAAVTIRIDGGEAFSRSLAVGRTGEVDIPIDHGGPTIIELEVQSMGGEMSLVNNRAVVSINGVRDRLRVAWTLQGGRDP